MSEPRFILRFECGATMTVNDDPRVSGFTIRKKDGRPRVVIYSSEDSDIQKPTMDGKGGRIGAPCFGCPKPRAAGTKVQRCYWNDDAKNEEDRKAGRGPSKYVISCHPAVEVIAAIRAGQEGK